MTDLVDGHIPDESDDYSQPLALKVNVGLMKSETEESYKFGEVEVSTSYLVVRIEEDRDKVWLINHDKTPTFPFYVSYQDMRQFIEDNCIDLIEIEQDHRAYKALDDLSDSQRKRALERFEVIKSLLEDIDALFTNHRRGDLVQSIIKTSNRSEQYVYDVLNTYFYYGQRIAALALPIGKNIHAKPKKTEQNKKRGRPNSYGKKGKALNGQDIEAMDRAYFWYNVKNGPNIATVYLKMLRKFYRVRKVKLSKQEALVEGEEFRIILKGPTECPTLDQLKWHFRKKSNGIIPVRDRNRSNEVERKKDRAGRTGNAFVECTAFGQVFEIDETPFDEELVSVFDSTRRTKIGKATLYFMIDRFTKYIVGVYITTENPSYNTIRQAILNAATDKTEFLESLGFNTKQIRWQYHGIPQTIFVDNAEFKNKVSEGAVFDLQTMIKFARPGRGDDKPNVEKLFDLFSSLFQGTSKAHQTKSLSDIASQLARKNACLTVRELYIIAIIYINYHNNDRLIAEFPFDRSMICDGVQAIPSKLCEWSEIYRPGYTIHYPKHELYRKLMSKGEVSVHREGITFLNKGLRYNCDYLLAAGYQDQKANRNKAFKFPCRYNEYLVDFIFIDTSDGLKLAVLDSKDQRFRGLTFYEARQQKIQEKKNEQSYEFHDFERKGAVLETLENLLKVANKEREKGPVPNITTIKENRFFESQLNRCSDVYTYLQAAQDFLNSEDDGEYEE